MRLTVVVALALVVAVAGAILAQPRPAPAPGPSAPGPGPGGPPSVGPGDIDQMIDRLGQFMGLTEAEKAATKRAARAKLEASTALSEELRALGELARNPQATDKQLTAALQKFDAALATYRQKIKAIDAQLVKALSPKARAGLTALGVIDNGLGMRMGMGRGMRPDGEGNRGARGPGAGTRP